MPLGERVPAILSNQRPMAKSSVKRVPRAANQIRQFRQFVGPSTGLALLAFVLFAAVPLVAHPMGNFSVSHYSGITLTRSQIELLYMIDMAEIPTFQELQAAGLKADSADPRISAYLRRKADEFWRGITL